MAENDTSPKSQLQELGLRPKKSWGQNFLHNESVLRSIASYSAKPDEIVLEIGAGLGHLTRQLLANGAKVFAIERDRDMANALRLHFADTPNLTIIEDNALTYDFAAFAEQHLPPSGSVTELTDEESGSVKLVDAYGEQNAASLGIKPCSDARLSKLPARLSPPHCLPSVVGNLPYHITSPILFRLLEVLERFSRVVCMVQKEVCDRIVALPNTDDYSALSALVSGRAKPQKLLNVSRGSFYPAPNVDSAVFMLTPLPDVDASFWNGPYRDMVNASFHARRKTLWNNLRIKYPPTQVEAVLKELSIDPTRRAETLSPKDFWSLAERLPKR